MRLFVDDVESPRSRWLWGRRGVAAGRTRPQRPSCCAGVLDQFGGDRCADRHGGARRLSGRGQQVREVVEWALVLVVVVGSGAAPAVAFEVHLGGVDQCVGPADHLAEEVDRARDVNGGDRWLDPLTAHGVPPASRAGRVVTLLEEGRSLVSAGGCDGFAS